MADKKDRPIPATPEERIAEHKRQMLLQVWLPLVAGVLLVLVIAVFTVVGAARGSSQIERWGNLSAIYVLIPTFISSLVTIALLFFMVKGLSSLIHKLPGWMYWVQAVFARIYALVYQTANRAAAPIVSVGGVVEGLKTARKKLSRE
jgi:hypothetical protein